LYHWNWSKLMSKTIIVTGHGRVSPGSKVTLTKNLLTNCKFGEVHYGRLVDIKDLSIFHNPHLLYDYLFSSPDYTSQGEWINKNTQIPDVILSPMPAIPGQTAKNASWQKPYVLDHYKKTCIYELKNVPGNTYQYLDATNMHQVTLHEVEAEASRIGFLPLLNRIHLVREYESNMKASANFVNINNHACSLTVSNNDRVYIFDYETGPSMGGIFQNISDDWSLSNAIIDIEQWGTNHGIPLAGVNTVVVKTCLSL